MFKKIDYETVFNDHDCKICGRNCKNRRSLGNHLARSHKPYDIQSYLLEFYLDGKPPKCKCGCGQETLWKKNKYSFGTYINGHNNQFTSDNQPSFTESQIEIRNESIRKAYRENGEEIKEKISSVLIDAWNDEEKRENWERARKDQWQKNGWTSDDISKLRKKVWKEQYDELYEKIFTPEFGKKISQANMRRGMKHSSKKEKAFIEVLRKNLDAKVIEDYWINHEGKSKCFDAYLPDYNTLVEFDGIFWHGLDRDENFTISQLVSMTNDLRKNQIVGSIGKTLIRIRSDSNWKDIKSLDNLLDTAYYVQDVFGNAAKDNGKGSLGNTQKILGRNQLITQNHSELGGRGKEWTEKKYLPVLVRFLKAHVDTYGWFYPECDSTLEKALCSTLKASKSEDDSDEISSRKRAGTSYLKSKLRSFWQVQGGPVDAFYDDKKLEGVLRYRLGLNNSKDYTYTLDDGTKFVTNEHFDINIKNIRRGFIVQRHAVSFFKPSAACSVYRRFLSEKETPRVWDPSGGFGARLLGFSAAFPKGEYVATEPAAQLSTELQELADDLVSAGHLSQGIIINAPSESVDLTGTFDLVFTSPPYFDKEKYFDEIGQCWKDYPELDSWAKNYLTPTLKKACDHLRESGKVIVNISSDLEETVKKSAISSGLKLVDKIYLVVGRDHFSRKKGTTTMLKEPILIFEPLVDYVD